MKIPKKNIISSVSLKGKSKEYQKGFLAGIDFGYEPYIREKRRQHAEKKGMTVWNKPLTE